MGMQTVLYLVKKKKKVDVFVSMTAGELSRGPAVHPDLCDINPVLPTNLQSLGLPGGTQYGAQVR